MRIHFFTQVLILLKIFLTIASQKSKIEIKLQELYILMIYDLEISKNYSKIS
jgi:hypothetical protein